MVHLSPCPDGGLIAYASNSRQSLSEIYLPPFDPRGGPGLGYQGHDTFTITDNTLVRRFPVYQDGVTNVAPSDGARELHYQLELREAGWGTTPYRGIRQRQSGRLHARALAYTTRSAAVAEPG